MANHKSAKKRTRQTKSRNLVNKILHTKINNSIRKLNNELNAKNIKEIQASFASVNSSLAKAVKRGLIKKQFVARKLSSLSAQIKKI
tara:strand:+ start:856 stop:1116 length:261 start_codon:yes stop_codon:yes gene_type:complete